MDELTYMVKLMEDTIDDFLTRNASKLQDLFSKSLGDQLINDVGKKSLEVVIWSTIGAVAHKHMDVLEEQLLVQVKKEMTENPDREVPEEVQRHMDILEEKINTRYQKEGIKLTGSGGEA